MKCQTERLAAQENIAQLSNNEAYLGAGVGESSGLWPLLQQRVKDDVELLLVIIICNHAGQGGVGV